MPDTQRLNVDFVELSKAHANRWVALNPETGEVYAVGESAAEVYQEAVEKGVDRPFVSFIAEDYGAFAPWQGRS